MDWPPLPFKVVGLGQMHLSWAMFTALLLGSCSTPSQRKCRPIGSHYAQASVARAFATCGILLPLYVPIHWPNTYYIYSLPRFLALDTPSKLNLDDLDNDLLIPVLITGTKLLEYLQRPDADHHKLASALHRFFHIFETPKYTDPQVNRRSLKTHFFTVHLQLYP